MNRSIFIIFGLLFLNSIRVNSLKSGSCPNLASDAVGICIQGCDVDEDCEGVQKCCSNGCGNVCTNPKDTADSDVRPGACPSSGGLIGLCVEECSSDADCTSTKKCCSNGCGHSCQDPIFYSPPVTTSRPGKCPSTKGVFGICLQGCNGDSSCPSGQKCCSNGCGNMCQKALKCPKKRKPRFCLSRKHKCNEDNDCDRGLICCDTGCRRQCVKA